MQVNQCGFPSCSLYFANQYDLIAHIEYTHIPLIEEEVKRKKQIAIANSNGEPPTQPAAMNLPLSYYSRVFRTAYRPNPIKPEPLKVSFNHFKKRNQRQLQQVQMSHRVLRDMMAKTSRMGGIEENEKRLQDIDLEECGADNNEVRYRCAIVDCNKRYKSMIALRIHMKTVHNVAVSEEAKSLTNYPTEDVKPNIAALQQAMQHQVHMPDNPMPSSSPMMTPSNGGTTPITQGSPASSYGNPATNSTSFKCSYCSKRYKTPSGLSNHMMSSHQKNVSVSDIQDAPSPQVVEQLISQVRQQSQQEQNSEKASQKPVPTSSQGQVQTIGNFLKASVNSRSFSVTTTQQPIRYAQNHYQVNLDNQPSTGQVLHMQMQHQKRMKLLQEQQTQGMPPSQPQSSQHQQMTMQQGQFSASNMGQMVQSPVPMSQQQQHHHSQQQQQQHQFQMQHHQQQPNISQIQQHQQLQQQPQQMYHQMPLEQQQQQQQQNSPYPQQMHQMVQQSPYQQYQQHQQSPQFPYQQPSPQTQHNNGVPPGPPQRSPAPLSQSLPPLNSMAQQRPPIQQASHSNNDPMQFSPPNTDGFNGIASPPNNHQPSSQPRPYIP